MSTSTFPSSPPEYLCRWCGEPLPDDSQRRIPEIAGAHELCVTALGVHGRGKGAEAMLEDAALFEKYRPARR